MQKNAKINNKKVKNRDLLYPELNYQVVGAIYEV
jgi:hypothetical protein